MDFELKQESYECSTGHGQYIVRKYVLESGTYVQAFYHSCGRATHITAGMPHDMTLYAAFDVCRDHDRKIQREADHAME